MKGIINFVVIPFINGNSAIHILGRATKRSPGRVVIPFINGNSAIGT